MRRLSLCASVALLLLTMPQCLAHGDHADRIAALTSRIEAAPDAADLLLARGDLHLEHDDPAAALADYDAVRRLAPRTGNLDLRVARARLAAGDPALALAPLSRHLAARPDDTRALLLRARAHDALAHWLLAADDYRSLLGRLARPAPELFIARAHALLRAGADHDDQAFAVLDEGVARVGPLLALVHAAIDAATERDRHELALAWLDRLPPAVAEQPQWLLRRAEILVALQRRADAVTALQQARAGTQALPPARRTTRAARELERRIAGLLAALD